MISEEGALPIKRQRVHEAQPSAVTALAATAGLSHSASGLEPVDNHQLRNSAGVISPELVSTESTEKLRELYQHASPYPHCVLKDAFDPTLLAEVRLEIINNIEATYKETDLFKVFQTGDLANLDGLDPTAAAKLPALMALKRALYSDEFRKFIRRVTGCGELSERTDCSCNVYAQGGHLLCHDDVIGKRRVSWIVYLTDPEDPWVEADGGALELYPLAEGQANCPDVAPCLHLLPLFNTMALFTVLPGRSFHSVQEVLASGKPRMSISGWYHGSTEPERASEASLQQLQSRAGEDATANYQQLTGTGDASGDISDEDLALLIRYLNPAYLSDAAWVKLQVPRPGESGTLLDMQAQFKEDGSVQLQDFLSKKWAALLDAAVKREDDRDCVGQGKALSHATGVQDGWKAVGPPHKQRFLSYDPSVSPPVLSDTASAHAASAPAAAVVSHPPTAHLDAQTSTLSRSSKGHSHPTAVTQPLTSSKQTKKQLKRKQLESTPALTLPGVGELLSQLKDGLFCTAAFARLINQFTTLAMTGHAATIRRFRPGLDYTVAHYGILTKDPRLDAVLTWVTEAGGSSGSRGSNKASNGSGGGSSKATHEGSAGEGIDEDGSNEEDGGVEGGWESGELGGFEAYLLAEEETAGASASEVYRPPDSGDSDPGVLNVSATRNSLNLVLRDEGLMKFIKFVSSRAPSSRWDLAMEYLPEEDDTDDEN